jgi:acyl carrier protein
VTDRSLDDLKELIVEFNPALTLDEIDEGASIIGGELGLDSIMLVSLITRIEERFGFIFAEEDLSQDTFSSLGFLAKFICSRRSDGHV